MAFKDDYPVVTEKIIALENRITMLENIIQSLISESTILCSKCGSNKEVSVGIDRKLKIRSLCYECQVKELNVAIKINENKTH